MREIIGIMACDLHYVISNQGKLPWNCPEEINFYRSMIKNQIVIMGYKTYLQMPDSFFENHTAIVFSKKIRPALKPSVMIASSLDDFYKLKGLPDHKQCYLIGGAEITTFFLENKAVDHFYLSEIEGFYPGDVFFPMHLMNNYPKTLYKSGPGFKVYYYGNLKE